MDVQVQMAQQWLNATYGSVSGWVPLEEDGQTSWSVMYGLRRGLQKELGITPVTSGFGPATTAAFVSQIGQINGSTTKVNILKLLSAAMWCKGYPGFYAGNPITFATLSNAVGWMRNDLGLGLDNPFVDVKLMASLLSMDAYVRLGSGTNEVRDVQRWLNATYLNRRDFALVPCDGIYSRSVQTALTFGLQYEIGIADGAATGNFGPGTRDGIRTQGTVAQGSVDTTKRFVRLYQAVLRFNRYDSPFSGTFDGDTAQYTRDFQGFMELPVNGNGDYSTWCALLVSCGDTTIATKGFDTNKQLTAAQANGAVAAGYTTIGRYTVGTGKFITAPELDLLKASGLKLFPIHQRFNDTPAVMTRANGSLHGVEALERCRVLGLPAGSLVFFSVDFDAVGEVINGPVADYFRGVNDSMDKGITGRYKIGVYGTRNVCSIILDKDLAEAAFVSGMSTGYSGNMGFPMPEKWQYNQIVEIQAQLPGVPSPLGIDKDVVSSHATPIDLGGVVSPPIERDGSVSGTGFDAFFEWLVRAEVACERGLAEASTILKNLKPYSILTPSFVTHWLQRPVYWSDTNPVGQWNVYTPLFDTDDMKLARLAAEGGMRDLSPNKPVSTRDIAHFAATFRGYQVWDVPTTVDDYGIGDLGGWCLDLLSTWGAFSTARQQDPALNQLQYLTARIGVRNADGGFPWQDVVADADGYLAARALAEGQSSLSGALRGLLKLTDKQRVSKFYTDRFGRSEANVISAFKKLADGIDVGPVHTSPWTDGVLRDAAGAETLPNPTEATICAQAYARMMAAQG